MDIESDTLHTTRSFTMTRFLTLIYVLALFLIETATMASQPFEVAQAGLPIVGGPVAWGDYDNDGDLDIAQTGSFNYSPPYQIITQLYRNEGNGTFTTLNVGFTPIAYGDLRWFESNNDGHLDLIVTGATSSSLTQPQARLFINSGNGTFTASSANFIGLKASSVDCADYNRDGWVDILIAGQDDTGAAYTLLYRNNGDGTYTNVAAGLPGIWAGIVRFGDIDNDGFSDIFLAGNTNPTASTRISAVFHNLGNDNFININAGFEGIGWAAANWGDYDGDGDQDIVIMGVKSDNTSFTKVFRNNGNLTFTDINATLPQGLCVGAVEWGDYDNDGDLDLLLTGGVCAGAGGVTRVYRNDGNGVFTDVQPGMEPAYYPGVAWGDYNNDGKLDALVTGYHCCGDAIISKLYRNLVDIVNTVPTAPTNISSSVTGNNATLSWSPSTDALTPTASLTYNVKIGLQSNDISTLSPLSSLATGYRRVVLKGNAGHPTSYTINGLPDGTYYWRVQAVDNTFSGSPFSVEGVFVIQITCPGTISGTVTVNSNPLQGVIVKLLDEQMQPVGGNQITNTSGAYSFTQVLPGNYNVMVVEPLGYVASVGTQPTNLGQCGANTANFTLTNTATSNNARSKGYWKHQFDVYVSGKGNAQESQKNLTDYIAGFHQYYSPHFDVFAGTTSFSSWQSILSATPNSSMLNKAKEQLAALVLNLVSLKIGQSIVVTTDGRTAGQVLTYVSQIITGNDLSHYSLAKDLAEKVNTQQLIEANIVPSSSLLYKQGSSEGIRPLGFALEQNYPNPFNPTTTIHYTIAERVSVTLVVTNLFGQEVTRLLDSQVQDAGIHEVNFDATYLPSGMYFCKLQAGAYRDAKKMILKK